MGDPQRLNPRIKRQPSRGSKRLQRRNNVHYGRRRRSSARRSPRRNVPNYRRVCNVLYNRNTMARFCSETRGTEAKSSWRHR